MSFYDTNSSIDWVFEKAFKKITSEGKNLYTEPFKKVYESTFGNSLLHSTIGKLVRIDKETVAKYVTETRFISTILQNITNRIDAYVIMGKRYNVHELIETGYEVDDKCIQLAIVNNDIDMLKKLIYFSNKTPTHQHMFYSCSLETSDIYFYLRSLNLQPNISIYNRAVTGSCIDIVSDINKIVGVSSETLKLAFENNFDPIVIFLLQVAKTDKIKIPTEAVNYTIMNKNFELLQIVETYTHIDWNVKMYHTSLLSGCLRMIHYVESKIDNLHKFRLPDCSGTKMWKSNLFIKDTVYKVNSKNYFSHSINYAVQSNSLEVVKYVHELGYGITVSNFITAIKQSTVQILKYLCENYFGKLPKYVLCYLGFKSFIADKEEKIKLLIENNCVDIYDTKYSTEYYRTETSHIQLIESNDTIYSDCVYDTDYLMKYYIFFPKIESKQIPYVLITVCKIYLQLNNLPQLETVFNNQPKYYLQYLVDTLYLYGNLSQIKHLTNSVTLLQCDICPSTQIILEIVCYNHLDKLCYMVNRKMITKPVVDTVYNVATVLSNSYILQLFSKNYKIITDINYVVQSKNICFINNFMATNSSQVTPSKKLLKSVLSLNNSQIADKFIFKQEYLDELTQWTKKNQLIEMYNYLTTKMKYINHTQNIEKKSV